MWAFAKTVLLVARYFRRIAVALESLRDLYEMDLASRGIQKTQPGLKDPVEVVYGPVETKTEEESW